MNRTGRTRPTEQEIGSRMEDFQTQLKDLLGDCQDVKADTFQMRGTPPVEKGPAPEVQVLLVYLEGATDLSRLAQSFLPALQTALGAGQPRSLDALRERLSLPGVSLETGWDSAVSRLLKGQALLMVDGCAGALTVDQIKRPERTPADPPVETSIRGPRDGLIENIVSNAALIRKRLPTPRLACEYLKAGRRSHTQVALLYMKDLVDQSIIDQVRERVQRIDVDELNESAHLEEWIEDRTFTVFPLLDSTQRADKSAAALTEGRVVLLLDNLPTALIAPTTLLQFLQSVDDYQDRFPFSAVVRILRLAGLAVSLFLPGIYVAATEYHQDMLPIFLLLSLVNAHRGIPFPTPLESFVMLGIFELFREAGLRLPRAAGQTVGILGTVVVGDAAVRAGLASTGMLVVMGVTAVSTFTIPNFTLANAVSLTRFAVLIMATVFGYIGIVLSIVFLVGHWAGLKPFGVSYLKPFSPFVWSDWKDTLIRVKWTRMTSRPKKSASGPAPRRRSKAK